MEEAATPLPSEETTPPVTNIYFGAIRIVHMATRPPHWTALTSQARPTKPYTGLTYKQLWASRDILSIATLRGHVSKFSIAAQLFHSSRVRIFRMTPALHLAGSTAFVQLFLPTLTCVAETNCAKPSSKLESNRIFYLSFRPAFWTGGCYLSALSMGREWGER